MSSNTAIAEPDRGVHRRLRGLGARQRRQYLAFLYPAIGFVALFSIFPLVGMLALSLTDFHLIDGWGGEWSFTNFVRLVGDPRFLNSISVMLALSIGGVVVQLVVGTAVAVGLDQIVPNWKVARGFFTIPFAVPHVAVALVWLSLFTPTLSPINAVLTAIGLPEPIWFSTQTGAIAAIVIADTWANFPFVMLLVLAALQGIPRDLKEAASIDGASQLRAFFVITLPLLKPALLLVTLFRFIETLKHFPLIYVMTKGGPGRSTQATNYYAYVQSFENSNISYGAAISVTLFIFAAVASYWVARINARLNA